METRPDIFIQLIQQKEVLKNFSRILSSGYNLEKLLDQFLSSLQELLKVGRMAILIQEDECFKIKACRGVSQDVASQISFPVKEGLINYLTEEGTIVRMDAIGPVDAGMGRQLRSMGVTTAVPAWEHGRLKAVIVFNNKVVGTSVSDEELELTFALGSQLAIAIENTNLVELISNQRNYLENILTNVSSAVISVNTDGTITTYNTKAEEILGISGAEVIGKPVDSLPHDISMLIKETIGTGAPIFRKELKLSGIDKYVGISIASIRDGQNNVSGAVMIFTDLAPIKALEEQMRRTDRLDFTNTVAMRSSHELKNCLVSIKTFAQLLPERYGDKQFREDFYLVVNKEVDRLNQVVENLLFFAQPLKLDLTSNNIEELIQEALGSLEKEELLGGVSVEKDFRHTSPMINVDKDSAKKVLRHLFYNSIQAMPKGGSIYISTNDNPENNKGYFEIKIADDGTGIPDEISDKIWEPFFTTKTRGIGLGMTIVRKIVEAHNGTIKIVNKHAVNPVRDSQRQPLISPMAGLVAFSNGVKGVEVSIIIPHVQQKKTGEKLYFPSGRAVIV